MSLEIFLLLLLMVSVLTGLTTEAVKSWLEEQGKGYRANALAGYVAAVLSVVIGAGYVVLTQTAINLQIAVILIALIFLSWLAAMVGYDKVIQAISQFQTYKKGGEK